MNNVNTGEFIPPPPSTISPDIGSLQNGINYDSGASPPDQNTVVVAPLDRLTGNKDYAGMFWFRMPLTDNRSGQAQIGKYSRVQGKRASGALLSTDPGYLTLPYLTQVQTTNPPAAIDRLSHAEVFGTCLFAGYTPATAALFRETSSANPLEAAVAGFAPTAGSSGILALRMINVNGTPYLAICYAVAAVNSVQLLSDLINPPTSTVLPVGAFPTFDLIQTGIDGNALLIYKMNAAGQGVIVALRTDIGVGTAAISAPRCTLNPGGYAVGLSAAEGNPAAYWVEPLDGNIILYFGSGVSVAGQTFTGRLVRTDIRGYLPSVVDIPLAWVTYATKWRGGLVICDTQTHWYMNHVNGQRRFRRMPVYDDTPANSDRALTCRGHSELNGRLLIETNEGRAIGGTGNILRYSVEFDYDQWAVTQVSSTKTYSSGTTFSVGGASQPWSPYTNYNHIRGDGQWWRQFQPPLGVNSFAQRHTAGSAVGTGRDYETSETLTWPAMDIDGYEDCKKTLLRAFGPKVDLIKAGGTGATLLVEELLGDTTGSGPNGKGALFNGTEPIQRIPVRAFKGNAWTYQLQPRVTMTRTTSDTNPEHYTSNGFPIFIEGIMVKDGVKPPSAAVLKALDPMRGQ